MIKIKHNCVVPENLHTSPQKGLEIPGGWRGGGGVGVSKTKIFKECVHRV